jgi:hypothetical protein
MDSNEVASEVILSTADVAKRLNVGAAMVRKWAIAYEDATGDKVRIKSKRDGREFSASQVDVISRAKKFVDHERVKVDTALKMALGQTELVPTALEASSEDFGSLEALKEFLARNDETSQLLLQEIRGLRQDLRHSQGRELSQPSTAEFFSAPVEQSSPAEADRQHGILVKLAMRLESLLNR